jgi:serine-type D-Ala-D-Ala endopeptidase (penicillin-binding protein 7)
MNCSMKLLSAALFALSLPCHAGATREAANNYNDNLFIAAPHVEEEIRSFSGIGNAKPERAISDPALLASAALVIDQTTGSVLFEKNADALQPIASITKLMTAIVVLEAQQPLNQLLSVTRADVELARPTQSRLKVGAMLSRGELLRLMLMASENRAAAVLARSFPGGLQSFVRRMNEVALAQGLHSTRFADPTGLSAGNLSTARDLTSLVRHAYRFDAIRAYSTTPEYAVSLRRARATLFHNTNRLTRNADWEIGLSKTGYISASGQCLVLQASVGGRPMVMVILDSWGKGGRVEDAVRLRHWLEQRNDRVIVAGL